MQAPLLPALKRALAKPPRRADAGAAHGAGRGPVVVLGVGSELRTDDGAGPAVARAVEDLGLPGLVGFPAGPAPENATGALRDLSPSHVVIVDAADMGEPPGTVRLLDPSDAEGASFATHGLPLSVLAGYLEEEIGCGVLLIGIQPASLGFGESLSPAVEAAVTGLVETLVVSLQP